MSDVVEAAAALDQGAAEVSPLPHSLSSTPTSENGPKSPETPPRDTDNNWGRLLPVAEMGDVDSSTIDSTDVRDSTPDAVNAESSSEKRVCAVSSHEPHTPGDLSTSATNDATEKNILGESDSVSIKSEPTDNKDETQGSDTISNTSPATSQVDSVSPKTEALGSTRKSKNIDEDNDEPTEPDDIKCEFQMSAFPPYAVSDLPTLGVDQFDTANTGDVIRHYFTRGTRQRALSPVQEDRTYQLAVNSDLWIKIKSIDGPNFVFEVDSAALAAHSPVFSTMAYNTHTRGNKEAWVWELEGDSIGGMSVMLSLLHLDTRGLMFNQEPTAREVYDVLRVFSKYQIPQAAFYTWVKKWTEGLRNGIDDPSLNKVECLYAAYKLGDFKSLKSCIRHVAHEIEINADGCVRLANGKLIQEALPVTSDLVDNILAVRTADLDSLLPPFQKALDFFMNPSNAEGNKFCKSVDAHGPCNQKLLGALLQSLVQNHLYPVPTAASYASNVGDLAKKVSEMNVHGLILPGLAPHQQRHGNCKLGQDSEAKKIIKNEAYLPLSEKLVEHMYRATKDLGLHKVEQSEFYDYKNMFNKWKDCHGSWLSDDDSGVFDIRDDDVSSTCKASQ